MNRFCTSLCVVIFFLTGTFQVWAQSLSFDADSLFMEARTLAMNKDYTGAREKCYQLLEQHPAYHDARVLIGRTLAWEHKYDSARAELQKVIALIDYADAIDALIDVERWSGNQEKALYYCDYGLKRYPNYEDFMLKKARILMETGKSDLAQRNILHVLELNPGNVDARKLLQEVKNVNILNKISLQYSYEYFKEPWVRRWHLMNIAYSRQTRYGSVTGRVYLGDVVLDGESLFEKNTALQYELEAYPVLSKKNYAYISYGYSPDNLFPKHRFGGELYQKFLRTFELSAGIRNLQFRSSEAAKKDVMIYTGSLGKYYRNYWFSLRPYLSTVTAGGKQSYYFTIRRYLSQKDNFLSLELGSGSSPDDPLDYAVSYESFRLKMRKIQLACQYLLSDRWMVYIIGAYQSEEYEVGVSRNNYSAKLQFSYHF